MQWGLVYDTTVDSGAEGGMCYTYYLLGCLCFDVFCANEKSISRDYILVSIH